LSVIKHPGMDATYRKLLTYAYNIIGSYEDAKDVVQDVLEKYIHLDKSNIANEVSYLVRMVINQSINFKTKFVKHTTYGVWLPEPVSTETVESGLVREQVASYTLLVLMERLNAKERAVFVLREAFNYAHEEIAAALNIGADDSRQVYSRVKKSLNPQAPATRKPMTHKLNSYIEAIVNADVKALEDLFAAEIRVMADGGRSARVVKDLEIGREPTAQLLQYVYGLFLDGKHYTFTEVNHQPAICFWINNRLYNCQVFLFDEYEQISHIYSMVDPVKLRSIKMP
jgi:RNA polymerase sigma factor (sigma-70 family)